MTTAYQLLEGQHLEPIPDGPSEQEKGRCKKIHRGESFSSPNDWYADRWPEKFRKLDSAQPGTFVFDPTKETWEQFSQRVKGEQQEQAQPSTAVQPSAALTNHGDNGMREMYESMTVKELQSHAAEEEIDLHGATRKDEIVRILLSQAAPV